jgi:UMF1 family MFS transporter
MTSSPNSAIENSHSSFPPVTKKEIFAWAGFDFANSSFTTIMVTVIFPVYFTTVLCAGRDDGDRLWGLAGSLSNLIVVVLSPILGAIADLFGAKKKFLAASWLGCVLGTAALACLPPGGALLALSLFIFASVCFYLGENFVAGFLPEISTPETAGRISSYGWSIGYFGGLGSLLIARLFSPVGGILSTALFFFAAGIPTFLFLRERKKPEPWPGGTSLFKFALQPLIATARELPRYKTLFIFFLAQFFFTGGLITVIYFAGIFATRELAMTQANLVLMFLFLQLSAAAGAFAFGWLQDKVGSKISIIWTLILWIGVVIACAFTFSIGFFYVVAALAGVGIGSTQSCSRAMVSQLTPPEKAGEFFGFWGLFGKLSAVVALPIFGEISVHWGLRPALLSTILFFGIGLILLLPLPIGKKYSA